MKGKESIMAGLLFSLMAGSPVCAQFRTAGASKIMAVANGDAITEEHIRAAAGNDLENIETRKLQFDANFNRDKQAIYEHTLATIIDRKIVEGEALKRNVTPEALVSAEINRITKVPTADEVTAFWNQNRQRTNISEGDALPQIRAYLNQQARAVAYDEFMRQLRNEHKVQTYLEPLRVSVLTEGFPAKGPPEAPVTIVEFSDFECPFCAQIFPTLQQILSSYGDKVRLVYREFPLTNLHPHAQKAAEAALCAKDQHKFWEMHDAMFQNNKELEIGALKEKALAVGIDAVGGFNVCLDSGKYANEIATEIHEALNLGVASTPTLFINGRYLSGAQPYADIAKIIDEELQRNVTKK